VSVFVLACLGYLGVALPGSTLGLLWPSIRLSLHVPVSDLGILLVFGITASVLASAVTGRFMSRLPAGALLAAGAMSTAVALAAEAAAPRLWVFGCGMVLFGIGFGVIDAALNAYAASHFGARNITWMHASYGLGATLGPLLITALLTEGFGWRRAFGIMAVIQAAVTCVLTATRRGWQPLARDPAPAGPRRVMPGAAAARALAFVAVETGIESAAGIWGYLFLTAGRGLSGQVAGVIVAAYWAMMFAGRAVLGQAAQRLGASRVLAGAIMSVPAGAALMVMPGRGVVPVIGLLIVGLACAPVFPLFILTAQPGSQMVGWQVAASAAGGAVVPAGIGLVIGASGAAAVAPSLLLFSAGMCGLYLTRPQV
jgi:fucose permease